MLILSYLFDIFNVKTYGASFALFMTWIITVILREKLRMIKIPNETKN